MQSSNRPVSMKLNRVSRQHHRGHHPRVKRKNPRRLGRRDERTLEAELRSSFSEVSR